MSSQPSLSKSQGNQVRVDDRTQHAAQPRGTEGVYAPRVDIVETNDAVHMYAFMPGVRSENVSLHCKDGQLVLHGRCLPRGGLPGCVGVVAHREIEQREGRRRDRGGPVLSARVS